MSEELAVKGQDMIELYMELPESIREKAKAPARQMIAQIDPEIHPDEADIATWAGVAALKTYALGNLRLPLDSQEGFENIINQAEGALENCRDFCLEKLRKIYAPQIKENPQGIRYEDIDHPLMQRVIQFQRRILERDNPAKAFESSLEPSSESDGIDF